MNREIDLCTDGFADPVSLHLFSRFRPVEIVQVVQQSFGILRNFQYPLAHGFSYNGISAHFTLTINHLFVRQNGSQLGTPIYRLFIFVRQSFFKQTEEDPLGPFIVIGICCIDFTVPIVRKTQHLQLLTETGNILFRCFAGMRSRFYSILFRRKTECIPPDWMKHVKPFHSFVAG